MLIDVYLGHNKEVTLTYKLYENTVTKLFYERLSTQKNNVVSRNEFYNFGESAEDIEQELNNIINNLKDFMPELLGDDNTENLNQLHINFPANEQKYKNNKPVFDLLREFNNRIHHLERLQKGNINTAFLFTVDDDSGVSLPEEAYAMFTPDKNFGELYMNYPHVGKHFTELYFDNDVDIPKEQIQLTNKMASGLYCWLGKDMHIDKRRKLSMYKFFLTIKDKLQYEWDDPRLAIGYLPLGKITHDIDINTISQHKHLHSWKCY
tara:strand:- start:75 stop:866 length:792 start_codon:yes stop_codon:yes gene_type:complete